MKFASPTNAINLRFTLFLIFQVLLIILLKYLKSVFDPSASDVVCILYQLLNLFMCNELLKADNNEHIFSTKLFNAAKSLAVGALWGVAFAAIVVFANFVVRHEINLFPLYRHNLAFGKVLRLIIFQALVALSEESLFRFYLHLALLRFIKSEILVALAVALLFALSHYYLNGIFTQAVISFAFSLFVTLVKRRRGSNSFFMLASTHFIYSLFMIFIFAI